MDNQKGALMEQNVGEVLKTYWNKVEENHRIIGFMLYGDQNYTWKQKLLT